MGEASKGANWLGRLPDLKPLEEVRVTVRNRNRNQFLGGQGGFGGGWGNPYPGGFGGGCGGGGTATLPAPADPIHSALDSAQTEGFRLRDIEDTRYQDTRGVLTSEFDRFNATPAISEGEINQRFGQAAEGVGRDANQAYSNLREGLGGGGFTGGSGAGLASQIELARLGQLTGASRDLRLYKARLDSDKAMQRLQAAGQLGQFRNQSPSLLGLDVLGQRAGMEVTLEGIRAEERAAGKAASATKSAGKSSGIGSIIGGVLGAI